MKLRQINILPAIFALFAGVLIIAGCDNFKGDKGDKGYPGTTITKLPGTIQGRLIDSVTEDPIAGAVIDIGVATATTNTDGQFVLYNVAVPPNAAFSNKSSIGLVTTMTGSYPMTINLKGVTSPVNMSSSSTTPRYPDFSYGTLAVKFTYHEGEPVMDIVDNEALMVGKLAATITGVVAYSTTSQPVGSGWTVKLVSQGSSNAEGSTGGTGASENIVGSTTTDANGAFTFANIESLQSFRIDAWNSATTYRGSEMVMSPSDGETKTLLTQHDEATYDNKAVFVASIDQQAPYVISVSPENGSDNSPTGGINVAFTFSEAIKGDAYARTISNNNVFDPAGPTGIWSDVMVTYDGPKAGNIAHTMSWSSDRKTLTVNIPTLAPASKYTVDLSGTVGSLKDDSDVALVGSAYTATSFTTNGAATSAAPSVTLVNSASIDSTGVNPQLDWLPVSGAKMYNVYRAKNQVWGTTSNSGAYEYIGSNGTSDYTDAAVPDDDLDGYSFVENSQTKLTYSYAVKSVNADGTESSASTAVTAEDKVGVSLNTTAATFIGQINDGNDTITISFNEPLDESSAETVTNYALSGISGTAPTIASATYDVTTNDVTLTLSGNLTAANITRTYMSVGTDGIRNSAVAANDTALMPVGTKLGQLCVIPAGTGDTTGAVLSTPVAGDDVSFLSGDSVYAANSIYAGVNGTCDSAAVAGDTAVTGATAGTIGITAATYTSGVINSAATTDFTLQSTVLAGSDDSIVRTVLVTVSNVKDVAGNTVKSTADQHATDGNIQ